MQKLEAKSKNVPTDASLVRSSTTCPLNKEETLSVDEKLLTSNNLEVNYPNDILGALKVKVYVLSIGGDGLMPCSRAKAKKLLKSGKAKIVSYRPFAIQLTFECENQVQQVELGVDAGYENVGVSARTDKQEVFRAEYKLRSDVSSMLNDRKMYRRNRRNKLVRRLCLDYNVQVTYGYETKIKRHEFNIEKSHSNDAFVISGGSNQIRCEVTNYGQKRHNNRCLQLNTKGKEPSIRRQRYSYQPKDIIIIQGVKYEVAGCFNEGSWVRVKKNGVVSNFSVKKVERHYHVNSWFVCIPHLKVGVL